MLLQTLKNDQLIARRKRDTVHAGLLTSLVSEAAMVGKNKGNRDSTDEEVIQTIRKFLKTAEENLNILPEGEFRQNTNREINILNSYLPRQMNEAELRDEIERFKAANENAHIGMVMKHLQTNFMGRYDGKLASTLAQKIVGSKKKS